jgi:hypothetical protein
MSRISQQQAVRFRSTRALKSTLFPLKIESPARINGEKYELTRKLSQPNPSGYLSMPTIPILARNDRHSVCFMFGTIIF